MPGFAGFEIFVELCRDASDKGPTFRRHDETVAIKLEQPRRIMKGCRTCLAEKTLAGFAKALHQLDRREGEITHQPLDDPAANPVVLGKRDTADRGQPAVFDHAPILGGRWHVLCIALPKLADG